MSRSQSSEIAGDSARAVSGQTGPSRLGGFHAARAEMPHFRIDLWRSLQQNPGLALGIAILGFIMASAYLLLNWPVYSAETLMYIQPAPTVQTSAGVVMHWPYNYDPATYESYVQQQMLSMTRMDVVKSALDKLEDFRKSGESDENAAQRLSRSIEVGRVGNSYEVSIKGLASSAQMSADIANAVAASYIDYTSRERRAADASRVAILREETDRVKMDLQDMRAEQARVRGEETVEKVRPVSDLTGEIARLQARYDALDEQIQNLAIEDAAPETAHVAMTAVAPGSPVADGVVPRAVIFAAAFLLLALLAAWSAHKLDQRVYVASDVEQILGFAPIAELPDLDEVSEEVFEEQLLRLSAAIESAFTAGNFKSCVLTGTGPAAGVTTIAMRVRSLMEGMGRATVLVDVAEGRATKWPTAAGLRVDEADPGPPLALVQRLAEEARAHGGTAVLADAAPLSISAETEYLVGNTDCALVVIECGVTTRAELRATANALRRIDAAAVGYVLNRVTLARADASFKSSVTANQSRVRLQRQRTQREAMRERKVEAPPKAPIETAVEAPVQAAPTIERKAAEPIKPAASVWPRTGAVEAEPATEQPLARGRMQASPAPQMRISRAVSVETPHKEAQSAVPWWLADPFFNAEGSVSSQPEQSAVGAEAAAEPEPEEPESRLSGLRKLFINKNAAAAAKQGAEPADPTARRGVPGAQKARQTIGDVPVPEVSDLFPRERGEERATAERRKTLEVKTVPEILPPRKTLEGKRYPDAASRRERRDTWDDVSILPSWRGQYRSKE